MSAPTQASGPARSTAFAHQLSRLLFLESFLWEETWREGLLGRRAFPVEVGECQGPARRHC